MGNQKTPGLTKRGGIWHVDKMFRGTRLCESTGTGELREAQEFLNKRLTEAREARLFGTREARTFRLAATKYLQDYSYKRRIRDDAMHLKMLDPFIGALELKQVHMGSLQAFIAQRRRDQVKTQTLNSSLACVRRVLNLSAGEWMDEKGMTWLAAAPKIKLFPVHDARSPYPLSQEEQSLLFQELPGHLAHMALFKVNTGTREQEVCRLCWRYEVKVPELDTSVFVIPGERVKNGDERLVVLNRVAKSVIESQRGVHPDYVFAYARREGGDAEPGVEGGTRARGGGLERAARGGSTGGLPADSGARSQAHLRTAAARRGRELRGSAGPARASERSDHDALLAGRVGEPDRGRGEGVLLRVPQFSRNHLASTPCQRASSELND